MPFTQRLRVMKFTAIILTVLSLHLTIRTSAQTISLEKKNVSLKTVFDEIKKQTRYFVVSNAAEVDVSRKVTVHAREEPLVTFLNRFLSEQGLKYRMEKNTIVVSQKENIVTQTSQGSKLSLDPLSDPAIRIDVHGVISDESSKPCAGVSIKIKNSTRGTVTDLKGEFKLSAIDGNATLIISAVNIETKEINIGNRTEVSVVVQSKVAELEAVAVASNGYQDVPKERATGSFEVIDNKKLNLIQSPNILRRLEGNATDLDFRNNLLSTSSSNPRKPSLLSNLTIRGQNTLYGNSVSGSRVLVVIDGVPLIDNGSAYTEDEISKINPDDIESITLLKDAAAQSVYGSRAANGVIVIKTKRAKFNTPVRIGFSTNINFSEKPDLFYVNRISTATFVDFQRTLYKMGNYSSYLTTPGPNDLPPQIPLVAEILDLQDRGLITAEQANVRLADLSKIDVRNDFNKYILRNVFSQNYNINVSAGSNVAAYRFSLGYTNQLNNTSRSDNQQLSLNLNANFRPVKGVSINLIMGYGNTRRNDQSTNSFISETGINYFMPYDRLADDNGNASSVIKYNGYRLSWIDTVGQGAGNKLLDWHYYPLRDLDNSYYKIDATNFNATLNASYRINNFLSAEINYGYRSVLTENLNLDGQQSYYARSYVNQYTQGYTGTTPWSRAIPDGGLLQITNDKLIGQSIRGQLNFDKLFGTKHHFSGIVGSVIEASKSQTRTFGYYGYDERYQTYAQNLNFSSRVEIYGGQSASIPVIGTGVFPDNTIRNTKFYTNAAYTYDQRYTLSASIAKDASNVFGIDRNKSFKPYWSTGLLWNISNEKFYKVNWLPRIALRTTFGYNGNTNFTYVPWPYILNRGRDGATNYNYVQLSGLTNKLLRPEKVGQLNFALDFNTRNGRIGGSIEYYKKFHSDLIGREEIDPTSGYYVANFNVANMRASGISINITTVNIKTTHFSWTSDFLYSRNRTVIRENKSPDSKAAIALQQNNMKIAGNDVNTVYAIPWAGLNPLTGAPQYLLKGKPAMDYSALFLSVPQEAMKAMGSATPTFFGSLRNTFTYKNLIVSFNTLFKLGYVFRRPIGTSAISYSGMQNGNILPAAEYDNRWQKPGDEAFTNVPSFNYPANPAADVPYHYADINVLKADHIRIQEINFAYSFEKKMLVFKNARLSASISNLGIIWRANKIGLDPDILDVPIPRNYGLSFNANF